MAKFIIDSKDSSDIIRLRLETFQDGLYLTAKHPDGDENFILNIQENGTIQLCSGVDGKFGFKVAGKDSHVVVVKE